jgi:hypothetical protein
MLLPFMLVIVAVLGLLPGGIVVNAAVPRATVSPATVSSSPHGAPTQSVEPTVGVSPTGDGNVKYYIVAETRDGEREYLFDIAANTLGDGNRYREILELNRGRLQPDGGRLEDPAVLNVGWVLQLPADAQGPGVQTGPLPLATRQSGRPAVDAPPDLDGGLRLLSIIIIVLVLAAAVTLLRRGERLSIPALRMVATGIRDTIDDYTGGNRSLPFRQPMPVRPAARAIESPVDPLPSWPRRAEAPVIVPRPAVAGALEALVEATVRDGDDVIHVRLIGARETAMTPFLWQSAGPRPSSASMVALGKRDGVTLFVDLAQSPDVVSIHGAAPAVHRQTRSIARQLGEAGLHLVVVGDVLDLPNSVGIAAATIDEVVIVEPDVPTHHAVFLPPPSIDEVAPLRELVRQRRAVVVVVGDGPGSRWSLVVRSPS